MFLSQPRVERGPRILISLFDHYTTTPTHNTPKNLSTNLTSKLSFLTVTSITGDPSTFHNFFSTWASTSFFLKDYSKHTRYLAYCNFIQETYWLLITPIMTKGLVANGGIDRLKWERPFRKGSRCRADTLNRL